MTLTFYCAIIGICSYMRRRIKGAARAINAIWRTTVLHFPRGWNCGWFRPIVFIGYSFTEQTYCFSVLLVPQPWPWARGRDGGSLQQLAC